MFLGLSRLNAVNLTSLIVITINARNCSDTFFSPYRPSLLLSLKSDLNWSNLSFVVSSMLSETSLLHICACMFAKNKIENDQQLYSCLLWDQFTQDLSKKGEKKKQPKIDQFILNVNRDHWVRSLSRPNSCRPIHLNKLQSRAKAWLISGLERKRGRLLKLDFAVTKTRSVNAV